MGPWPSDILMNFENSILWGKPLKYLLIPWFQLVRFHGVAQILETLIHALWYVSKYVCLSYLSKRQFCCWQFSGAIHYPLPRLV